MAANFYSLTLANTQDDFESPALDVVAELLSRHKKAEPIAVPAAVLMDRHTLEDHNVVTCVFPVLRNNRTLEIVLFGAAAG